MAIIMAKGKCPDIPGICWTFLSGFVSNDILVTDGFDLLRNNRSDIQGKSGGGVGLYNRNSLNCKRRIEIKISNTETLSQTHSRFLIAQPTVLPTQHQIG